MAIVFVPALLRERTGGVRQIELEGATVGALIDSFEARYPGVKARLVEGSRMMPGVGVVVDGEVQPDGLRAAVERASEVHFVHAVRGGSGC
ncbi:MAG: MoaD/ThiS family protein [Thermoflexales bacterium]